MTDPEQALPSWDELNSRLEALLGRLEAACSNDNEEEATGLMHDCAAWRQAIAVAAAVGTAGPSPADREALARWGAACGAACVLAPEDLPWAAWAACKAHSYLRLRHACRALNQAGQRLAVLDARPHGLMAACSLMLGCEELAATCSLELSRYAWCLALILRSGTSMLEEGAQALDAASQPSFEAALGLQTLALHGTLTLLQGVSPDTISSVAPPLRLVRWWGAVAGALEALERLRRFPGQLIGRAWLSASWWKNCRAPLD